MQTLQGGGAQEAIPPPKLAEPCCGPPPHPLVFVRALCCRSGPSGPPANEKSILILRKAVIFLPVAAGAAPLSHWVSRPQVSKATARHGTLSPCVILVFLEQTP